MDPEIGAKVTAAIILAAGASRRMGFPKALLLLHKTPALTRVIDGLTAIGCRPILTVLGRDADRIRREIGLDPGDFVRNPAPDLGQSSSLQIGLAELPEGASVCLFPVDHAAVQRSTLELLAAAFRAREPGQDIVVPSHGGRRGHPVFFAPAVVAELRRLPAGSPAREVVRRDPRRILHVEVDDAAVCEDLDTPEDLRRAGGEVPEGGRP